LFRFTKQLYKKSAIFKSCINGIPSILNAYRAI
jgi:hypothetical protein